MALSDTCFDAIADLKNDFHFYIGWRPYIGDLSKAASIMLDLASLAYSIEQTPELQAEFEKVTGASKPPRLIAECYVIGELLSDPETNIVYDLAVDIVGEIATINADVRSAIINAYNWQQSLAGIAERFRSSDVINVEPVYRRIADL